MCVRRGSGSFHERALVVCGEHKENVRDFDASVHSINGHILPAHDQSNGELIVSIPKHIMNYSDSPFLEQLNIMADLKTNSAMSTNII